MVGLAGAGVGVCAQQRLEVYAEVGVTVPALDAGGGHEFDLGFHCHYVFFL